MAITTGSADLANHSQNDVLGSNAKRQLTFDPYQHVFHFLRHQALGCEHVLHFRGTDAMRQGTKRTVGGGVRVAADYRHAGQGCALFWADDVDDALTHVIHLEFGNAILVAVFIEGLDLQTRDLIDNGVDTPLTLGCGRHVVVRGGDVGIDAPGFAIGQAQAFEGLRRRHFMNDMTIDIDQRRTIVALLDQMRIPELVVERFAGHQTVPHQRLSMPITTWLVRTML
ncbi:hypothetical protein D3C81_726840 [compost metagenome]